MRIGDLNCLKVPTWDDGRESRELVSVGRTRRSYGVQLMFPRLQRSRFGGDEGEKARDFESLNMSEMKSRLSKALVSRSFSPELKPANLFTYCNRCTTISLTWLEWFYFLLTPLQLGSTLVPRTAVVSRYFLPTAQ